MHSTSAFHALLKRRKKTGSQVIFISTNSHSPGDDPKTHKSPRLLLSRCQRHEFRRIPLTQIIEKLRLICAQENIQIDEDALSLIARQSTGSMRDAISLVDQLASLQRRITLASVQDILGTTTSQTVIDLIQAIQEKDSASGLGLIHAALDGGADPSSFARAGVELLGAALLVSS